MNMGLFDKFFRKKSLHGVQSSGWRSIINEPFSGAWQRNQELKRVSTRSRPKAAGSVKVTGQPSKNVSTRSRPKAAGYSAGVWFGRLKVSTRSRPKAAGFILPG